VKWFEVAQDSYTGEHSNEPWNSIQDGEFRDQFIDYKLLKKSARAPVFYYLEICMGTMVAMRRNSPLPGTESRSSSS
jgi:hypothetical protein